MNSESEKERNGGKEGGKEGGREGGRGREENKGLFYFKLLQRNMPKMPLFF